jgi:hypothetical protein
MKSLLPFVFSSSGGYKMIDRTYLKRRAAQEADLACRATDHRAAAAHEAMAAAYFKELARISEAQERGMKLELPPEL